jgi:hypothetical protein
VRLKEQRDANFFAGDEDGDGEGDPKARKDPRRYMAHLRHVIKEPGQRTPAVDNLANFKYSKDRGFERY